MAACWTIRGCEGDLNNYDHCPHAMLGGRCPVDCQFSYCERPQHKQASALDLLEPTVDRSATIKEMCLTCEFCLQHGPRKDPEAPAVEVSDPTAMTYRDHANPGDRW